MNSSLEENSSSNHTKSKVIYICSITPLHPGIGRVEGVVDLPVQRDAYGLPTIYSSSLKGTLKSAFQKMASVIGCNNTNVEDIFGSPEGMGAINILDSHLLMFPARSLKGIVIGVTTPFLIRRHISLAKSLGVTIGIDNSQLQSINRDVAGVITQPQNQYEFYVLKDGSTGEDRIIINELPFKAEDWNNSEVIAGWVRKFLAENMLPYKAVAIVHDNWLRPLLRKSMEYRTRIRLNYATKRPERGGLWTVELIPPGCVFSTFFVPSYAGDERFNDYIRCIESIFNKGIFVGGDETVGAGLVKRIPIG